MKIVKVHDDTLCICGRVSDGTWKHQCHECDDRDTREMERDARLLEADEDERLLGFDQYSTTGSMEGK